MATASCPSGPVLQASEGIVDEVFAISERLQILASAAALGAEREARAKAAPKPATCSSATNTDVAGREIAKWEEAETLLAVVEGDVRKAFDRVAAARERREEAAARANAAMLEVEQRRAELSITQAEASVSSESPFEAEARARHHIEAEAREEAVEAEARMEKIREADAAAAAEDERIAAELREEIAAQLQKKEKALAEAAKLASDASVAAEAGAANNALRSVEEAEAAAEQLEEDQAHLKEELGTLRFSLKENKRFQHKRVQELTSQAQRLERKKQQLEEQQAARLKNEGNNEGQLARLHQLQQLNERLQAQVKETCQERDAKIAARVPLEAKLAELRQMEASESNEVQRGHERLDQWAESDGTEQREVYKLTHKASWLSSQVNVLEEAALQSKTQYDEAETALSRSKEEEQSAERRAEIMKWKLQVAETQLNSKSIRGIPRSSGRGTGAASDSSAGVGPGAIGGDESPGQGRGTPNLLPNLNQNS